MAVKAKFCVTVFLLSVLVLLCAALALATKDPELKQCKHQCGAQREFEEDQRQKCESRCEDYYREKIRREGEGGEESEEEGGEEGQWDFSGHPREKRLQHCQKQCERQHHHGGQEKQLCRLRCQQRFGREREEGNFEREREEEEEEESWEGDQERHNPYVFEEHHFSSRVKTEHGSVHVLPRFTQRSKLLWGLRNHRLSILVANPQAFVQPNHFDADAVFFVTWGRGAMTLIREDGRESFHVQKGDIVRVPAGTPFYVVNTHENEKLYIVKFFRTINLPGQYEVFHGAGGQDPESFFRAFSWEILEAAFKVSRRDLESVFGQQDQGSIIKASREQIRALSHGDHSGSGGIWPFGGGGGESRRTSFNLFKQRPSFSNNFGKLFEAGREDFQPLQDLDLRVLYANVSKGAMSAPFFNSKTTKVVIVVSGEGYLEIACPHISSSSSGESRERRGSRGSHGTSYQKVSSPLRTDTVFIIPAGHPFVTVASTDSNLEMVCFEINAEGNVRHLLAGEKNMFNFMHKEAKQLAFNARGEMVDRVFRSQEEHLFFPGPRQQQRHRQEQQGHAYE